MTTDLAARRNQALGAGAALFYRQPLQIVRGEGAYLFDADGRRYVDMYNNVPCVGHANPVVAEAMSRQQATLNVHSRYLHEGVVAFAERLAALHGPQIESVVFSCSGTEANEVGLRTARFATGKRGIVFTDATYHGNSDLVSQLTRVRADQPANPELRAIPFPQMYRPLETGLSESELADAYLDRLRATIEGLERDGVGFAALIVCSIFANEGLPDVPRGFMGRAAEMVHAAGGLLIADEVQAGYGRTGVWWGYDVTGFTPDIVVTGKPMGNGLPLAATAASRALIEGFRSRTHYFNTFASSPLQAAVGMAVLDEIEHRGLIANVAAVGGALKQALVERKPNWDAIGDVRGHGLFIGVEMVKDPEAKTPDAAMAAEVSNRLKDRGFLTAPAGAFGNVVKMRPPLVFSQGDAEAFLGAFDTVVAELRVDKAEAARVFTPAAREALKAFPIAPEGLKLVALSENITFRVTDRSSRETYVLRLHRPGYHTDAELESERGWTRALAEAGIDVPIPLSARDGGDYVSVAIPELGQRRWAGMSSWTEGEVLADLLKRETDPSAPERYFEQLGAIEAAMHNQSADWRPTPGFTRHAVDRDGLMGDAPFWGRFWEHPVFSPAERGLVIATRDRIRGVMDRLGRDPSVYGMIHADLHDGNLLVGEDGRLTVIDFDDCAFGWYAYDIAVGLFHQQDSPQFGALSEAFASGYRTRRELGDDTLALIPMFLLVRGLAVTGWLLQRPEIDASRTIGGIRDRVCAQCEAFEPPL